MQVLELYRIYGQVVLECTRPNSIVGVASLRAKDERLARTYLLSKILEALLVEDLSGQAPSLFPWRFPLPRAAHEPQAGLRALGPGGPARQFGAPLTLKRLEACVRSPSRHRRDPPRRRQKHPRFGIPATGRGT